MNRSMPFALTLLFLSPAAARCADPPPWLPAVARGLQAPVKAFVSLTSLLTVVLAVTVVAVGLTALALVALARDSEAVERIRATLEAGPRIAVGLGALNLVVVLAACHLLTRVFKGLGLVVSIVLLSHVLVQAFRGLAAVGRIHGRRLWECARGPAPSEIHEAAAGLGLLFATVLCPFVGVLFVLWNALGGLGAAVRTTLRNSSGSSSPSSSDSSCEE